MWKLGLGWQPQHREEAEERGKKQERNGSGAARNAYAFTVIECSSPSRLTFCTTRRCLSLHQSLSLSLHLHRSIVRSRPSGCTCPSPSPSGTAPAPVRVRVRFCRASYVVCQAPAREWCADWRVASGDCDRHRHRQNQWCARAHRPKSALCMIVTSCHEQPRDTG